MKQINALKNKILQLLNRLSFFKEFTDTEKLFLIDGNGMVVLADEGEYILREGANDTSLYILMTGELAVRVKKKSGEEVTIAQLHPGDIAGEVTFISDKPRSASVIAIRQSVLFRCSRATLNTLPASAREKVKDQIIAKLIDRLHQNNIEITQQ